MPKKPLFSWVSSPMGNTKYLLAILLLIFIVFGNSIFFDYLHLDEDILIVGNSYFYKSSSAIKDIFFNNAYYPSGVTAYYRPFYVLSFIGDTYLGGSTHIFHATNLILHALASLLVFIFLKKLQSVNNGNNNLKSLNLAFFLSLLFAVHPIVVQTVSWVPARGDSLLTIFLLLSIIQLADFLLKHEKKYLVGHFIFFFLALFSKETALALPVLCIVYLKLFSDKELLNRKYLSTFGGWLLVVLFWYFLRQNALTNISIHDPSISKISAIFIQNFPAALLYLGKMLLPVNMSVFPLMKDSSLLYGVMVVGILIFYAAWNFSKLTRYSFLGFIWLVAFLVPIILNYDDPDQMAFFEHRAYLPLIGFLILVLDFVPRLNCKYVKIFGLGVILTFATVSYNYNFNLKNAPIFWRQAVTMSPQSARAHAELAKVYVSEKKLDEAEHEYLKASELNPQEKNIHNNLALLYIKQGLFEKAETELMKEMEIDKFSVIANFNLGNLYARQGKLDKANPYWLEAITINPNHLLTHESLAKYYYLHKDKEKTLYHINEIVRREAPLSQEMNEILESIKQ